MKETLFIHLTQLFMKHFILWGLTLAAVVLGGCSDDYDDTELRTGLNDLRDRVAKLETQLTKLNGEITTIDALVRKLESNVSVVKVEPGTDGKSYTIYFSDDTKAVIANGQDGAAGKDAPVIGVKEEDLEELAKSAFCDVCTGGNPKDMTEESILGVYRWALKG